MQLTDKQTDIIIDFTILLYNNGLITSSGKFTRKAKDLQREFNRAHELGSNDFHNYFFHALRFELEVNHWQNIINTNNINKLTYIRNFLKDGYIWLAAKMQSQTDSYDWHWAGLYNIRNDDVFKEILNVNRKIYKLPSQDSLERAAELLADNEEFDDI